jgi:membrane-bound ClpP family serine protease
MVRCPVIPDRTYQLLGAPCDHFDVILLIIGFVAGIAILWTLGIVVVVIGVVLALLGMAGHAVGGRRHYF